MAQNFPVMVKHLRIFSSERKSERAKYEQEKQNIKAKIGACFTLFTSFGKFIFTKLHQNSAFLNENREL